MGSKKKSGSKKKRLEAQKVKLKVGRRLTKSNVTSTAFKSGKIVLPEQIPAHRAFDPETATAGVPGTAALEAVFRDQVNKLAHSHQGARYKAVTWLRKTLSKNSQFLAERLHDLLQRVVLLLRDSDGAVRQATRLFLCQLVAKLSDAQMEPHWPLLAQHLSVIFDQSHDANLHSECVNLLTQLARSRPRAVIVHCTTPLRGFVARLAAMPAVQLVGYLSINVGDGSLTAIARSVCQPGSGAEPLVERLIRLLETCLKVGSKLLAEKSAASEDDDVGDAAFGYRARQVSVKGNGDGPLHFFVNSPLSWGYRLKMQQFAAPVPVRLDSCVASWDEKDVAVVTFPEKMNELSHLADTLKKLNKKK